MSTYQKYGQNADNLSSWQNVYAKSYHKKTELTKCLPDKMSHKIRADKMSSWQNVYQKSMTKCHPDNMSSWQNVCRPVWPSWAPSSEGRGELPWGRTFDQHSCRFFCWNHWESQFSWVALELELCLPSRSEYIRILVSSLGLPSEYDYWLREYSPNIPLKSITTS